MIKTQEKKIGDVTYQVTQKPAFAALGVKARLIAILTPAFGEITKLLKDPDPVAAAKAKLGDIDMDAAMPALQTLIQRLPPAEFQALCLEMMTGTQAIVPTPGGQPVRIEIDGEEAFNQVFTERLLDIYPAMFFVLQVNDFFGFGGIGKGLSQLQQKLSGKPSMPPQAS